MSTCFQFLGPVPWSGMATSQGGLHWTHRAAACFPQRRTMSHPAGSTQGFHFLHALPGTHFPFFRITATLVRVKWYVAVVFASISLVADDTEHLFTCVMTTRAPLSQR